MNVSPENSESSDRRATFQSYYKSPYCPGHLTTLKITYFNIICKHFFKILVKPHLTVDCLKSRYHPAKRDWERDFLPLTEVLQIFFSGWMERSCCDGEIISAGKEERKSLLHFNGY